jgi:Icc-related predicted phosphoesterase
MIKITHLSDTHGVHQFLNYSGGDILIHTGDVFDFNNYFSEIELLDFFERLPYQLKLIVQGNHDNFQTKEYGSVKILDNQLIKAGGLNILGSNCILPDLNSYKINHIKNEDEINKSLNYFINDRVDILCTHGSPKGIFDKKFNNSIGSVSLLNFALQKKPRFHFFGHTHHSIGKIRISDTEFINNSIVYNAIKKNIQSEPLNFFI